jgi:hypothetical protein
MQEGERMQILGREPTLWLAVISSILAIAGTFGLGFLNGQQAALFVVVINGAFAAINAYAVRPISPVAFTYFIGSAIALMAAYGLNVNEQTVVMINLAVVPMLALLSRVQVSPVESAISQSTVDPLPEAAAVSEIELDEAALGSGDAP